MNRRGAGKVLLGSCMKDASELHEEFETRGFLSKGIAGGISHLRSENSSWFSLVDDLNNALVKTATASVATAQTSNWDRNAVAVRILMRACGTLAGVILMTERGMVAEGRILARSLIEDAFCMAALHDKPDEFLALLKKDFEGSQRLQVKFILAQDLIDTGATRDKLQAVMDALSGSSPMSPKAVAEMGPLFKHYLAYQRLSDDSAHTSARSLEKHVLKTADETGWTYKWGVGSKDENAATLHIAIMSGIAIGVAITQILGDGANNSLMGTLMDRFIAMPPVPTI